MDSLVDVDCWPGLFGIVGVGHKMPKLAAKNICREIKVNESNATLIYEYLLYFKKE